MAEVGSRISLKVKPFRGRPLDYGALRRAVEQAQLQYSDHVAGVYIATMDDFSSGTPEAYPIVVAQDKRTRKINIYVRGYYQDIYRYLDFGFTRKVLMTNPADKGGVVGAGKGRVVRSKKGQAIYLPTPVKVPARSYTQEISQWVKHGGGDKGYISFHEHVRWVFSHYMRAQKGHR